VALTCSVTTAPAAAVDPITCGLSPTYVSISGAAAATSKLTISSTARTKASALLNRSIEGTGGTLLAIGALFFLPTKRRRKLGGLLALVVLGALVSLGGLMGCGGSSHSSSTGGGGSTTTTGTTAGSYVVTVTATSAEATTQTTMINVTVN
jgi:hypothetical protein